MFESLVLIHTTFSSRFASRFLRWKTHTCATDKCGLSHDLASEDSHVLTVTVSMADFGSVLSSFTPRKVGGLRHYDSTV